MAAVRQKYKLATTGKPGQQMSNPVRGSGGGSKSGATSSGSSPTKGSSGSSKSSKSNC